MDESQLVTTMTPIASALGRWSPSFSSHTGETVAPEDKRRCRYNVAGRHLFLATNHASLSNLNISWNNNRISKTRMSRPNTQILSNYIKLNCFTSSDIHPSPSSFTNDWQELMKQRRAIWILLLVPEIARQCVRTAFEIIVISTLSAQLVSGKAPWPDQIHKLLRNWRSKGWEIDNSIKTVMIQWCGLQVLQTYTHDFQNVAPGTHLVATMTILSLQFQCPQSWGLYLPNAPFKGVIFNQLNENCHSQSFPNQQKKQVLKIKFTGCRYIPILNIIPHTFKTILPCEERCIDLATDRCETTCDDSTTCDLRGAFRALCEALTGWSQGCPRW